MKLKKCLFGLMLVVAFGSFLYGVEPPPGEDPTAGEWDEIVDYIIAGGHTTVDLKRQNADTEWMEAGHTKNEMEILGHQIEDLLDYFDEIVANGGVDPRDQWTPEEQGQFNQEKQQGDYYDGIGDFWWSWAEYYHLVCIETENNGNDCQHWDLVGYFYHKAGIYYGLGHGHRLAAQLMLDLLDQTYIEFSDPEDPEEPDPAIP